MPDFPIEDDIIILGTRDLLLSRERWSEVARSIYLKEVPREMKEKIAHIFVENMVVDGPTKATQRKALKKLVGSLRKLDTKLYNLQRELNSNQIIDQMKGFRDRAKNLQITVESELSRTTLKRGRPRKTRRTKIAFDLLDVYIQYTGKPIRLSRDWQGRPSGPCYRFLCAIFRGWISTKGLAHVIEQKRDMLKTLSQTGHNRSY
jgi:hypothetical protein